MPKFQLAYLAGPVDLISEKESKFWRENLSSDLSKQNISSYSPPHAFTLANSEGEKIMEINWKAIEQCDLFILNLTQDTLTIGGIRELQKAIDWGKHTIIIIKSESMQKHIVYLSDVTAVVTSTDAVLEHVKYLELERDRGEGIDRTCVKLPETGMERSTS